MINIENINGGYYIAEFKKVSYDEYKSAYLKCMDKKINEALNMFSNMHGGGEDEMQKMFMGALEENIKIMYENIKIPKIATIGSMGHDIFAPFDISIQSHESITIPTGLRCEIEEGWGMFIVPRSGLGTKFRMQLDNTIGVIDQDYQYADNSGHIMLNISVDSYEDKDMEINIGDGIAQAIFLQYGRAKGSLSEDVTETRNGAFGSTTKKEK